MRYVVVFIFGLLLAGCAPKLGEDIIIKPEGKIYLMQSKMDVTKSVLNWIGGSKDKNEINLKSHVKIENKWHSDITLKSLKCDLIEKDKILAKTTTKDNYQTTIASGKSAILPILFSVDMRDVDMSHMIDLARKSTFFMQLKGTAIISLYGIDITKEFTKELDDLVK